MAEANRVDGDLVEDTYAEAFRGMYAEVLVTARDRKWLDHAGVEVADVAACPGGEPANAEQVPDFATAS